MSWRRSCRLCVQSYDELFLLLDALDECPEDDGVWQNVLEGLERLAQKASNIKMLVTSREITDVRESMVTLGINPVSIAVRSVDADIQKYTSSSIVG